MKKGSKGTIIVCNHGEKNEHRTMVFNIARWLALGCPKCPPFAIASTRKSITNALLHQIASKKFPLTQLGRRYQHMDPLKMAKLFLRARRITHRKGGIGDELDSRRR